MEIPRNSFLITSPAKLNLFLDVLRKRPDGYHDLLTLFERITLADTVRLTELRNDEIVLSSGSREVPSDSRNLAFQAADLIRRSQGIKRGVKIEIDKRIPVAAGLGGGSSNAAAVLLGINNLFGLRLDRKTLVSYANRLGSDVAFFVLGKRFAIGREKGGELEAVSVPRERKLWHVLFCPPMKVMTRDVYELLDSKSLRLIRSAANKRNKEKPLSASTLSRPVSEEGHMNVLTTKFYDVNILLSYLRADRLNLLNRHIYNRLSEPVMKSYSLVSDLKLDLLKFGLRHVHMTGSGPALFTIFKTQAEAQRAFENTRRRFSDRCRVFLASTL